MNTCWTSPINPCKYGSVCTASSDPEVLYTCSCLNGCSGKNCDQNCSCLAGGSFGCSNGGVCNKFGSCNCSNGFAGPQCTSCIQIFF